MKFVLLPGQPSPQLSLSRHLPRPAVRPPTESLDHLFTRVRGLFKATTSTSTDNITGAHCDTKTIRWRCKVLFNHLSFPTTLIHMHTFIYTGTAKRLIMLSPCLAEGCPCAAVMILFTHMNRPLLRPCEIGSCNALIP